jgi:SAM-dependent methyltransferase
LTPSTHFAAEWLQRREPLDALARNRSAIALDLDRWLAGLPRDNGVLRVTDLGCGLGANLRWLAPRIGGAQHWNVFDHDEALLAQWPTQMAAWAAALGGRCDDAGAAITLHLPAATVMIHRHCVDLSAQIDTIIAAARGALVTASALLDLVSASWFDQLVHGLRTSHALFALSVDGRISWQPVDKADANVQACFEAHQHRDKGFGPALGAQAPVVAERMLKAAGFDVRGADADWDVAAAMQGELISGMSSAAIEQQPDLRAWIDGWRERRSKLATTHARLRIGHRDLIASPPARSTR